MIDTCREKLVTIRELAKHYGISEAATWRLVLSGKIESVKIGRNRRTSLEAGQRFIERTNAPVEDTVA